MSKGLAKMVARMYPSMREIGENQPKFPVGTVIPYFDPYTNRYIFNMVTKEKENDHPSYYAINKALTTLREAVQACGIRAISLSILDFSNNQLEKSSIMRQLYEIFGPLNIKIHLYNYRKFCPHSLQRKRDP